MEISIFSLLVSGAQAWLAGLQNRRDAAAGRTIDATITRYRMLRQEQIRISVSVTGGSTHPNGGILKLSLSHTGNPYQDAPFMLVAGGALFVVGDLPGPQMERDLLVPASNSAPLLLYPGRRYPPVAPIVSHDDHQMTMRDILNRIRKLRRDSFSITGYVEEQDGSVYFGETTAYRAVNDWVEPLAA